MTIEQKAQRYNEALERAMRLYEQGTITESLSYIFPELKESEDERIRKAIVATIHLYYGEPLEDEAKEMIAWLEKQGKTSPILANSAKTCKDEQKSTDNDIKEALRTEYEKGRADAIAEMQVAWSEEDEETLGWLCTFLNIYGHEFYEGNEENVIDWLKSFKSRIQLQQEWSEEDETTINNLVWAISNDCIRPQDREDYCDWLKSLKDRYSWKPSDKQREALEHFVRSIEESGYASPYDNNTKLLYSLLSDLKKLKGE